MIEMSSKKFEPMDVPKPGSPEYYLNTYDSLDTIITGPVGLTDLMDGIITTNVLSDQAVESLTDFRLTSNMINSGAVRSSEVDHNMSFEEKCEKYLNLSPEESQALKDVIKKQVLEDLEDGND